MSDRGEESTAKKRAEIMAKYAYKKVPMYSRIAEMNGLDIENMDFDELPIVTKADYVQSGMSCLSSEYIGDYIGQKLKMTRTSGSTGKFTEVYWRREDEIQSLFSLWMYRKKYYNISSTDRMCYFFPSDIDDKDFFKGRYFLGVSRKYIYNGQLKNAYEKILLYNPIWMILQPSVAALLCDMAEQLERIPQALQYIEFTGEYLEPVLRKRVQQVFKCRTANQYGTKEVNSIAYECPEGNMHCMINNVYLEVFSEQRKKDEQGKQIQMDESGDTYVEKGEFCVTSLQNRAMPLVRFCLEDNGEIWRNMKCSCGNRGDVLKLKEGRKNDWIIMKNGKKVHSYTLMQIIHRINYLMDGGIIQYQIRQKNYQQFVVLLVLEEKEYFKEIEFRIEEKFRERLGKETQVDLILSDMLLPTEKTGKLACFVSELYL